jgi:hypothetical protein
MSSTAKNWVIAVLAFAVIGAIVHEQDAKAGESTPSAVPVVSTPMAARTPNIVEVPIGTLPESPCTEDDTRDCYWDGGQRQVGKTYSYWIDRSGNVVYLDPKLNDTAGRLKWQNDKRKAGWEKWGAVDGHQFCYTLSGPTQLVDCWDGYRTTV